jgi:hypothetical protein
MEKDLKVDLQEARKWYNGDNKSLRDLALKVYTKDELENAYWAEIKSWKDVLKALHIYKDYTEKLPFRACYAARVQMIRTILNKDYDIKFNPIGAVWYPELIISPIEGPKSSLTMYAATYCGKIEDCNSCDDSYVGVNANSMQCGGGLLPIDAFRGVRTVYMNTSLLCCATKEIAEHFGKYFYFEILASCYGDIIRKMEEND